MKTTQQARKTQGKRKMTRTRVRMRTRKRKRAVEPSQRIKEKAKAGD